MPWPNVLELHHREAVKLHGLFDIFAFPANRLHSQVSLFKDLAHVHVVGRSSLSKRP